MAFVSGAQPSGRSHRDYRTAEAVGDSPPGKRVLRGKPILVENLSLFLATGTAREHGGSVQGSEAYIRPAAKAHVQPVFRKSSRIRF